MSAQDDHGLDDPTVVGHRPIGPTRGAPRRPGPASGPVPSTAGPGRARSTPQSAAFDLDTVVPTASAATRSEETGTAVQAIEEPKSPEDTLIAAASPLLLLVAQLRNAVDNADVGALRREVVEQVKRFEERAVKFGGRAGDVSAGRYVLCALIDETVMSTPWGSASSWSTNSLLNQFHGETWGGEKAFEILDRVMADPPRYLSLLKLIDMCLLLGFEGKYRVLEGGRERLEDLRNELGRLLRQYGMPAPKELSGEWRGVTEKRSLRSYLPLWVVFALAGVGLVAIYGALQWRLNNTLAPIETRLDSLAHGS